MLVLISLVRLGALALGIHQIFYWVYFWQQKEYRLDRFKASFEKSHDYEKRFREQVDLRRWYRPAPTLRALVTVIAALLALGWLFLLLPHFYAILLVIFAPFIATVAVAVFSPLFSVLKRLYIASASAKMRNWKGTVIGITGSVGKSSTKELLAAVLGSAFSVYKTSGNDNSEIGVALTVEKLPAKADFFIVEMGAYRRGDIKAICDIVRPKVGIITAIGDQHLALFGSKEILRKTKFELIDALPADGLRLVAGEDYKEEEAEDVRMERGGISFTYGGEQFSVPLLGKARISNIVGVIKAAAYAGLTLPQIAAALKKIDTELFYPKLREGNGGAMVLDDTHNSSRESFMGALEYLDAWEGYQKIVVTPGIIELGERAEADHLLIGERLKSADKVFVTAPNFFDALNASGNAVLVKSYKGLHELLLESDRPNTVILFEGRTPRGVIDALIKSKS